MVYFALGLLKKTTMTQSLRLIPGESGLPLLGHSLRFMRNCNDLYSEMYARYGSVYYNRFFTQKAVHLLSPDGNEFVLLDRENNFSSKQAWDFSLAKLFPNGLMLRDGDDHRYHRRLLGAPFKNAALKQYVALMSPDIKAQVAGWQSSTDFHFYPWVKQLTLDLAAEIFVGESLNENATTVNRAFIDLVQASMVIFQVPLFGNTYQRGLKARAYLEGYFLARIPEKRDSEHSDMFAEICRAVDENGNRFSNTEIVDHMIFLMMAAHDTTTSSLSSVCYVLAKHPEWQEKIRQEIRLLDTDNVDYSDMSDINSIGLVLKEALRLYPPLPVIPRMAVKDCEFDGFAINKGNFVNVSPAFTHRMPEFWSNPDIFDPERFNKERSEHTRHRHAWIPFGGGAHKCLGLNFAELQIKLVLFHLLKSYQLNVPSDYVMPYKPAPIGKPSDQLPLGLTRV